MRIKSTTIAALAIVFGLLVVGCAGPRITLFPAASDPLQEVTLTGKADDKILVISINGVISTRPKSGIVRTSPSVVQEVVSHLRLAEQDDRVKAVLFKIDTPGGSTTASDMLYHEILSFKERTGKKVLVCMMNLATSGGYYISLPADMIMAHPTTVTGSIGVILMRPEISGFMEKIGVGVQVNKSGKNKDMGSPFRPITEAEAHMLQDVTERLGQRFIDLVKRHRDLDAEDVARVADARIFLAEDALALGLVDKVGYLQDALDEAKQLASLDDEAKVVIYRRTHYPDDNLYNTLSSGSRADSRPLLLDLGPAGDLMDLDPGFYYLWPQSSGGFR